MHFLQGWGKTTLAHVVAKHCGYRPFEINASDDRTAGAFHTKITDAAEMKSVIGSKRPNCIIIDEIDGATGQYSSLLTYLLTYPVCRHCIWRNLTALANAL